MAYSDYGAFVYRNGERRYDKEDVACFTSDLETFGCPVEEIPSGLRIWFSLIHNANRDMEPNERWLRSIHHGILGDGMIRVVCHKQGLPDIFELDDEGNATSIKYCDDEVDRYDYGEIKYEYKGYKFRFTDGAPYTAEMIEPDGTVWLCEYDYEYGAGFEEI